MSSVCSLSAVAKPRGELTELQARKVDALKQRSDALVVMRRLGDALPRIPSQQEIGGAGCMDR